MTRLIYLLSLLVVLPVSAQDMFSSNPRRHGAAAGGVGTNPGTANLITYWAMEDATDSHGALDWTNNGPVTFETEAVVGNSGLSDVSAEYGQVAEASIPASMYGDNDLTICLWVRPTTLDTSPNTIISIWDAVAANSAWRLTLDTDDGGNIRFHGSTGSGLQARQGDATNIVTVSQWNFVCAWHVAGDGSSGSLNIEVNNSGSPLSIGGFNAGFNTTPTSELFLWTEDDGAGGPDTQDHIGYTDEVSIWSDVLTADERTWLYNSGSGRAYSDLDPVEEWIADYCTPLYWVRADSTEDASDVLITVDATTVKDILAKAAGTYTTDQTQGTASARGTWDEVYPGMNNRPMIATDGTDYYGTGGTDWNEAVPYTVFVVGESEAASVTERIFGGGYATPTIYIGQTSTNNYSYQVGGSAGVTGTAVTTPVIYTMSAATGNDTLWVNGNQRTTADRGDGNLDGVNVMADEDSPVTAIWANTSTGVWAETLVCDGTLTTTQRNTLKNYYASYYGITVE